MGNATAELRAAINRDRDIPALEEALIAEGLASADGRRRLRTVPRTTSVPWIVPLAISIGIVVAMLTSAGPGWGIAIVAATLVATYTIGVLIELAARRSPARQNTAGDLYLLLLTTGWFASVVVMTREIEPELYAYLLVYAAPIAVAIAAMYAGRAFGSFGVVLGRLAFLFPVIFLALFIPLFTEEFWLTFSDLRWQAGLLGLTILVPFVLATVAELRSVSPAAFERGAERLEQPSAQALVETGLRRSLRRLPRFTRDLMWVAALSSISSVIDLVDKLAVAVTVRGGGGRGRDLRVRDEDRRVTRCTQAFVDAQPTTYAAKVAAQLDTVIRRRIWLGVPILVFTVATGLTIYVYLLIVLIVKAEIGADWAIADAAGSDEVAAARFVNVLDTDIPWDPHLALALTGGVVATVVLLAYVLLEERYKVALADAVLHSTVERSLLLAVPHERLQAPANSLFSLATKLSGSRITRLEGTNLNAIKQRGEPLHAGNPGGRSVWFKWVPPSNGMVMIDTTGSEFNTLLAVYTGHRVDELAEVASSSGATKDAVSVVRFRARSDTVYMIAVDGHKVDQVVETGTFRLNLALGPPTNDRFEMAHELDVSPGYGHEMRQTYDRAVAPFNRRYETTVNAEPEHGEVSHSGGLRGEPSRPGRGKSIWYRWTAESNDRMTIDCAGSDFDVVLAVYVGTRLDDLTKVVDNVGPEGRQTNVSLVLEPGVTYYLAVDGFELDGAVESGRVCLAYWIGRPPNDQFGTAVPISGPVGTIHGCNHHARSYRGEAEHPENPGGKSIWYRWVAPASGEATFTTEGSTFDTLLAVYVGTSRGRLSPRAYNDDREPGVVTSEVTLDVDADREYFIMIDGFRDAPPEGATGDVVGLRVASGSTTLRWVCPPRNCSLASAERIKGREGAVRGSNLRAKAEFDEPRHALDQGGTSIWYAWRAPATGRYLFDSHGSENDTVVAVYTGEGLGSEQTSGRGDRHSLLERVEAADPSSLDQAQMTFDAVAGTEYRIAIDSLAVGNWPATAGATLLTWRRMPAPDS